MELLPLTSFFAAIVATVVFLLHRSGRRKYKLPPGPRPWPVIGNLNVIGELPHHSLQELSQRYGPLISLRFGSIPYVVGSSVDAAKLLLKTHDLAFIDRPRTALGKHIFYNYSGMLTAPFGAFWRQGRKLWHAELLSATKLRLMEHVRVAEVRAMVSRVAADGAGGRPVSLRGHLHTLSLNVISRMVLGKKYVVADGAVAKFWWMMEELFFLMSAVPVGDLFPWLSWLDPQGYIKRMRELRNMFDVFLDHVLDEHMARRRQQQEGDAFVATDMVDVLLQLADQPNLEVPINWDDVKAFTLDLMAGGSDTSSVTLEWATAELLRRPDIIVKAAEELDRVVGPDRLVSEGDLRSLPYMESIVKETMRLHPISPLLAPRLCRENVSMGKYDIPAGTRVLVNVWAIGRDPTVWDSPQEFRPQRFLGSSIDVKGHGFELLPFGSGRRMCPGIGLGLKMVQLALANLLHAFAWRLPDAVAPQERNMDEKFVLTLPRKFPLQAVAQPRLPAHLYQGQQH